MESALHTLDPTQLAAITDLELLARTVVDGFLAGLHRSPHSGSSIEFAQYRPYVQGDDLRFVDWKLYGRTDRLHLKQFQEETNLRCTLLLDCSASMDYASAWVTKFDYGRMLTACLAMMLDRQRDAVGFVAYHQELICHIPSLRDRHHLRRVLSALEGIKPAGPTDTAETLRVLGDLIPPRGMVVLVSDLLHPMEGMIEHLKSLRARRHDVLVLQVCDPAELTFPFDKTTTFIDAENAAELYAVPDLVRQGYFENRANHFAAIRRECLAAEIDVEEVRTDEPLGRALHAFLSRRNRSLMTNSATMHRSAGGRRG